MDHHITDQDLHCMARRLQWQWLEKTRRASEGGPCLYCKYNADCFPHIGLEDYGKMAPNMYGVDEKLQAMTGVQLADRGYAGMEYLLKGSVLEEHPLECRRFLRERIESCRDEMELLRRYKLHQEGEGKDGEGAAHRPGTTLHSKEVTGGEVYAGGKEE